MMHDMLRQAASNVRWRWGQRSCFRACSKRPIDVRAHALSIDDKRAILAAWASNFYAIDSKPALRRVPEIPEPVLIDEVQAALKELDRRYGI